MKSKGRHRIDTGEHLNDAAAKKVIKIDTVPGRVIPAGTDISAAGEYVARGSIIRILPGALTYVAFGGIAIGAVDVNTTPAIRLENGVTYMLVATDDYIRTSANPTRIEVIKESDVFATFEV
jgi:hypothetical protein